MSPTRSAEPLAVRVYRALLHLLLSRRFHQVFADEMVLVFAELHAAALRSSQRLGGVRALLAELPDLVRLAAREHGAARAERSHHTRSRRRERAVLESLVQDVRFSLRALARSRGFTAVAVLTLALGVGANTAIFSVVDGVLLKRLALPAPERLVAVGEVLRDDGGLSVTSPGSFFDWKHASRALRLAAYSTVQGTVTGRGEPERLQGVRTVGGMFELLGAQPLFGRTVRESDEDPTVENVIVLSYRAWHRMYGEDRGIVGSTVTLNGTPRTIVGVMAPDFRFPDGTAEFWTPARFGEEFRSNRDQYFLAVIGRLTEGATLERARAEMATVAARLRSDWPLYNAELRIDVVPLRDTIVAGVKTRLLILMGAVVFVLLITCANLGNLLLARATTRRREMAIRQALGAGRGRIARQLLTESLVLALLGGAAGLLVGRAFLTLLLAAQETTNLPRVEEIVLDQRVLLFTLGVSLLAGVFFGSLPAWNLSRARSAESLREGSRGSARHQWTRSALVVSELALALILLTGAGLLLRSFQLLQRVDPGIRATNLLTFDVALPNPNPAFVPATLEAIGALPGVRAAAAVSQFPVTGRGIGAWFNRLDRPVAGDVKPTGEAYRVVTPEVFGALGIPLRQGRLLTADDTRERPAVVINEALARRYYPGEDPVGREIYLGAPDNRLFERGVIVGVVGDTRDAGLGSDPLPTVYIPLAVMPTWPAFSYVIRTTVPPLRVAGAARQAVRAVDGTIPVRNVRTADMVLHDAVAPAQWSMTLLGVFALLAVTMAALGIFGVLSYTVTQRTRELGIRLALGAAPGAVRRMVVRQGLGLVVAGLVAGLAGSLALLRVMSSLLYGVAPTDPATFAAVAAVLVTVATAASYLPARRATRVDPMIALRAE
jgi:putative ABC transport system permease protein